MKHRDSADEIGTWHPSIVDGAYMHHFGKGAAAATEEVAKRRFRARLAASTWAVVRSADVNNDFKSVITAISPRTLRAECFSPDLGETLPVFDFVDERRSTVSTALEIPASLDRSRSTVDRFKNEVLAWHSQLTVRHIDGLNKRLDYLFEDEPESSKSQALPDINSFGVLLAFLARNPEIKTPSLGYNRDGMFSATWVGDQKLRMSLDFVSSSSIRWIFVDSRDGLKSAVTGAGIVPLDILAGVLNAYGARSWMKS